VEVDPAVSRKAGERLRAAGWHPAVVVGDGAEGCADHAPYDRILVTVGVRAIPGAWIEQTRPGGLIVAPWGTHFTHADAVARLTVHKGTATGRFTRPAEFMKSRAQRLALPDHGAYDPSDGAETSTTDLMEAEFVAGQWWVGQGAPGHARFGLTVTPDGHRVWLGDPVAPMP
jgi:protein-L-isoaspartate O-methyltransferase